MSEMIIKNCIDKKNYILFLDFFLLFYYCFNEFNLQFQCSDKMGFEILALGSAF
jgi:hypothetical protein